MWVVNNITHANMLIYPLDYDIISPTSLKITQTFHLLLDFAEYQIVFWNIKIQNSVWITKGLDNGDSDNQGSAVFMYSYSSVAVYHFETINLCTEYIQKIVILVLHIVMC